VTATAVRPAAAGWDAAWSAALDRVELDAAEVETMLVRLRAEAAHVPEPPRPWAPPERLGPLPASLATRAQAVLERHHRLAGELTRAMTENRRQRQASAALSQVTARAAVPVYIDTAV
jgi:hypothetical protein